MKELAEQWTEGRFSRVDAPHEIYNANLATVREVIDDVRSRGWWMSNDHWPTWSPSHSHRPRRAVRPVQGRPAARLVMRRSRQ
jgi:hypothetical protein